MNNSRNAIIEASPRDGKVDVRWGDGHSSRFHLIWLRDNCLCKDCGDRSVGQKLARLIDLPDSLEVDTVSIDGDGDLALRWRSDGHRSRYAAGWLRDHCYCDEHRTEHTHKPVLWDCRVQSSLPEMTHAQSMAHDSGQHRLLAMIRDHGFALVHGVPASREGFEAMARRIGYLRETNYGRICDLVSAAVVKTLSNTKHAIPLHTDEGYRHANPGMLAFLCLSCSEDAAGSTLLADGFAIAEELRLQDPVAFELLCKLPMAARRYHPDEADLRSQSPVISVDHEGRVQGVRYNERSAAPLNLSEEHIEPAYAALRAWLSRTADPRFHVEILLEPGDFVVFDNQRVLHGRQSFGGHRHLLYCQLDLDEAHSRARVLQSRLGLPPAGETMHRGT